MVSSCNIYNSLADLLTDHLGREVQFKVVKEPEEVSLSIQKKSSLVVIDHPMRGDISTLQTTIRENSKSRFIITGDKIQNNELYQDPEYPNVYLIGKDYLDEGILELLETEQ